MRSKWPKLASLFQNTCTHYTFSYLVYSLIVLLNFVVVCVRCLFLTVPWVGLCYVVVAFPDHTHFLFIRLITDM